MPTRKQTAIEKDLRWKLDNHRIELTALTTERDVAREAYIKLFAAHDVTEQEAAKYKAAAEGKPLESPRVRHPLPDERQSTTWHLRIGDRESGVSPHIQLGFYPDGTIGEIFIEVDDGDKVRIGAMADGGARAFSVALQYGCPLKDMANHWLALHGGVHGSVWTLAEPPPELTVAQARRYKAPLKRDIEVWSCTSLFDAIARKLLVRYCGHDPFSPAEVRAAATKTQE